MIRTKPLTKSKRKGAQNMAFIANVAAASSRKRNNLNKSFKKRCPVFHRFGPASLAGATGGTQGFQVSQSQPFDFAIPAQPPTKRQRETFREGKKYLTVSDMPKFITAAQTRKALEADQKAGVQRGGFKVHFSQPARRRCKQSIPSTVTTSGNIFGEEDPFATSTGSDLMETSTYFRPTLVRTPIEEIVRNVVRGPEDAEGLQTDSTGANLWDASKFLQSPWVSRSTAAPAAAFTPGPDSHDEWSLWETPNEIRAPMSVRQMLETFSGCGTKDEAADLSSIFEKSGEIEGKSELLDTYKFSDDQYGENSIPLFGDDSHSSFFDENDMGSIPFFDD